MPKRKSHPTSNNSMVCAAVAETVPSLPKGFLNIVIGREKGYPQRLNGRRQPEEGWSTCCIRGVTMHLMDRKREEGPPDVGMYPPNGYGLYDMVGSLWQWCRDDRRLYSNDRRHRPVGPLGGDWYSSPFHMRCSRRGSVRLAGGSGNLGFRCVRNDFKN